MLLLDSHVLLWWMLDPDRLSQPTIAEIIRGQDRVFVSAATIWEIEIKRTAGRLELPGSVVTHADEEGFTPLPIMARHAAMAAALPTHHKDPFDRMLVAQASIERLTLVTADRDIARYDVATLAP